MTPEELQANYVKAVLFYCGVTNSDPRRFFGFDPSQLSPEIGTLDYITDTSDYYVASWELTADYPLPTNTELQAFSLLDVLVFYQKAYEHPQAVISSQPFAKLTTTEMNDMEIKELRQDCIVTNTTLNRNFRLRGENWVIGDPQPVHTSKHDGIVSNVTFSSGTVRSIPFTAVYGNANSGFTLDTATGVVTYNLPTKKLKISYVLSVHQHSILTSGVMESFININDEKVAIPSSQNRSSMTWSSTASLSDVNRVNVTIRDIIECNPGDTISLGGFLASGSAQGLDYFDISCEIEGTNF